MHDGGEQQGDVHLIVVAKIADGARDIQSRDGCVKLGQVAMPLKTMTGLPVAATLRVSGRAAFSQVVKDIARWLLGEQRARSWCSRG